MPSSGAYLFPPGDGPQAWELDEIERRVAAFLRGRSVYLGEPAEDWVQRCQIHWSQQRDKYDAARGASLRTFLHRIVDMRLRELARNLLTQKRTPDREALTLDAPTRPTSGRALGDTLTSGDDPEG